MRFAFYGRVSTEDQQDPTSSRAWQLAKAEDLIAQAGGEIVAEFFDIGQSRSLPWKRRPEAAALLEAVARPDRGFEAIVVGELARAFGDGMDRDGVMRVLDFYEVDLWHPDAAGRHDRLNIGHRITAALRAELAQEERETIKRRVKDAMRSQAQTEGRFLGGRPPYGYTLGDAGHHPNPSKAATGQRLRRLEVDPVAAPIVQRIFAEYVGGLGLFAIAEGLTRDRIPSPSAHDPARNRHRQASKGAWSKQAIRAILANPRYTGHQVWGRQPKFERLLNVEDPGRGYSTKQRWADRSDWVWSAEPTHEALVDGELFARAQEITKAGARRPVEGKRHRTERRYILSGLMVCGLCGRRMQGNWSHDTARYRCRFPSEYALTEELQHPLSIYVREDDVLPALDRWLASALSPKNIDATCEAMAAAQHDGDAGAAQAEAAKRKIADCDERLRKYHATLDAGADPAVVAGWIAEAQGERLAAERELARSAPPQLLSKAEIKALAKGVRQAVKALAAAPRDLKAELYAELGLRLEYQPGDPAVVNVELPLVGDSVCRRGDLDHKPTAPPLRGELVLG